MVVQTPPSGGRSQRASSAVVSSDTAVDGDAGSYLEELLEPGEIASTPSHAAGATEAIELTGPHLRLAGTVTLGRFRRLSDLLNHHQGPLLVQDSTILRRNGTPTRVTTPSIWVNLGEVTLIGQPEPGGEAPPSDMRIAKETRVLVVVTPGHTLTGEIYVPVGGMLDAFIESVDPPFVPMTNVRTRSLADRRIVTHYAFALLNRRHIVAATEAPAGVVEDRRSV